MIELKLGVLYPDYIYLTSWFNGWRYMVNL